MPSSSKLLATGAVAIGFAIAASGFAVGQQWGLSRPGPQLGMPQFMRGADAKGLVELGNNEGVYVDKGTFKLSLGKGDTSADQISKMGAKEVAHGAIIFRSGDKLYLVDWKKGE
jgi:hypothetical protein